jgi:hypothetical protein
VQRPCVCSTLALMVVRKPLLHTTLISQAHATSGRLTVRPAWPDSQTCSVRTRFILYWLYLGHSHATQHARVRDTHLRPAVSELDSYFIGCISVIQTQHSTHGSVTHIYVPELSLLGMTYSRTEVRVLLIPWPSRGLANACGGGYERFSYADVGRRLQGDTDATDSLQQLERQHRATPSGAVEAAIFVHPLCGDCNVACALAADNCFCQTWTAALRATRQMPAAKSMRNRKRGETCVACDSASDFINS